MYDDFSEKVIPVKPEEILAKLLFHNKNIKIGKILCSLQKKKVEKGVCSIAHLMRDTGAFLTCDEFNPKYELNDNFLTHFGCVQSIQKYVNKIGVEFHSNKPMNLNKSLTTIYSVAKGIRIYYDIFIENETNPKCCMILVDYGTIHEWKMWTSTEYEAEWRICHFRAFRLAKNGRSISFYSSICKILHT